MCVFFCVSGALQISDSQETDQGKYECVAENSVGTQHATTMQLWVRGECYNFFSVVIIIILLFCDCFFFYYYYIFVRTTEQTACRIWYRVIIPILIFFAENPIVRKNKEQTRKLKSHYFPFICFSFSFFIRRDLCTFFFLFLTFILNVIYDSDLWERTR